mgnify:CR=1 FL=1
MNQVLTDFLTDKIFKQIVAQVPLLGYGPIGYVFSYYLKKIIVLGLIEGENVLIEFDKHEERLRYDKAKYDYEQSLLKGDKNEIDKKLAELIDSFRRHVKFN